MEWSSEIVGTRRPVGEVHMSLSSWQGSFHCILLIIVILVWLLLIERCVLGLVGYQEGIMSPDTVSSLFPDRPIRPLPKRRLRERLSPDVADSIEYPPEPASNSPLFYYSYSTKDEESEHGIATNRERSVPLPDGGSSARDLERDKDSGARRVRVSPESPTLVSRLSRGDPKHNHPRKSESRALHSTASSVDGYDSFENTNNKKKRKIPDTSLNGGHSLSDVSAGISSLAVSSPSTPKHDSTATTASNYYVANNAGVSGISGPGRGRFGRSRNGRSPLRALSDANSPWAGRGGRLRASTLPTQPGMSNNGASCSIPHITHV